MEITNASIEDIDRIEEIATAAFKSTVYYAKPTKSPAILWGISSTLVPSSTPKAVIAARIVNGAHSRDITRPS